MTDRKFIKSVRKNRSGDITGSPLSLRKDDGFTLIDVSIILILIGLFLVPTLHSINIYYKQKRLTKTNSSFQAIDLALEQYYFVNGDYPCPADPTLSEADATYGEALDPCDGASDPDPAIGAVPFKALKIPVEDTLDGYKNKITYAVAKNLTNDTTFAAGGNLNFRYRRIDRSVTPAVLFWDNTSEITGHYALISHGPNGHGGFSSSGVPVAPCAGPGDNQLENENCNGDNIFIFHKRNFSELPNNDYYDDRAQFQSEAPVRIWMNSSADADDIFSDTGLVGVGTDTPEVALDVEGNIRTVGGNTNVTVICERDVTSLNCFSADIIGGSGIGCGTNEAMTGIANADANCGVTAVGVTGTCPTYAVGIDPGGNVICAP